MSAYACLVFVPHKVVSSCLLVWKAHCHKLHSNLGLTFELWLSIMLCLTEHVLSYLIHTLLQLRRNLRNHCLLLCDITLLP